MIRIDLTVSPEMAEDVRAIAQAQSNGVTSVVRQLIREALDGRRENGNGARG